MSFGTLYHNPSFSSGEVKLRQYNSGIAYRGQMPFHVLAPGQIQLLLPNPLNGQGAPIQAAGGLLFIYKQ